MHLERTCGHIDTYVTTSPVVRRPQAVVLLPEYSCFVELETVSTASHVVFPYHSLYAGASRTSHQEVAGSHLDSFTWLLTA